MINASDVIPVVKLKSVNSTNVEAIRRLNAGDHNTVWIVSDEQISGRGRADRQWHSPPGNLYATLLWTKIHKPINASQLSFVAANAIFDTISRFTVEAHTKLKWPNDCLVNGAKISGILCEFVQQYAVLGCGINVATCPQGLTYATTRIHDYQPELAVEQVFAALQHAMMKWLKIWNDGDGFALVRQTWLDNAFPIGSPLRVNQGDSQLTGTFAGLANDGALLLDLGGIMPAVIYSGDVALGAPR